MATVKLWNGDPNDGGREIPGELTRQEDGTFTFRPYEFPAGTSDVYVTFIEGDTVHMRPLNELIAQPKG